VSSSSLASNAGDGDPWANPWGPKGKGGSGVTLLTDGGRGTGPRTDVTILGTGHVAFTLGIDLRLNGAEPKLLFNSDAISRGDRITPVVGDYRFTETLFTNVQLTIDLKPEHFGYIQSTGGVQAMRDAKIVVVTLPDAPQTRLALFRNMQRAGLVEDPAKTFVLIRGGQAGQPVLSQMIRDNPNWRSSVVLVEDSPYGTRVNRKPQDGGAPEIEAKRKKDVEISVLGERGETELGTAAMREMFPLNHQGRPWPDFEVVPGVAMPWRAGYFIHPGVAFDPINLAKTKAGVQYLHYAEGVHPELGEQLSAIDREGVELAARYGVHSDTFPEKLQRQFGLELRDEPFHVTMARTYEGEKKIYRSKSLASKEELMTSRYPQEDIPGLFTINWLAERSGGRLPAHIAFEGQLRQTLLDEGMSEYELTHELGGYLPHLDAIEGGIPEITQLLNEPHVRPT
jgi:hypothetical protein